MNQEFFIGVDGGATKCIVRVEDADGRLLGTKTAGPANMRLSVEGAWCAILSALESILAPLGLNPHQQNLHAGMGIAGCEVKQAYESFVNYPHGFKTLIVSSDAHVACLGAHGGKDGAIIIAGTGAIGFQASAGRITRAGGLGFPHDDEGGGAWIGLQAANSACKYLDGRLKSRLAEAVLARFENADAFITWANQANSTAYAELAPIVIQEALSGDEAARSILKRAAKALDEIGAVLAKTAILPCSLIGGLAAFIEPYLSAALRSRLVPAQAAPDAGAVYLVRQQIK